MQLRADIAPQEGPPHASGLWGSFLNLESASSAVMPAVPNLEDESDRVLKFVFVLKAQIKSS